MRTVGKVLVTEVLQQALVGILDLQSERDEDSWKVLNREVT